MRGIIGLLCIFLACHSPHRDDEEPNDKDETFFSWMQGLDQPMLEITFSWDSLMHHRELEDPIDAVVKVFADEEYELSATISSRGQYRKKYCDFPPLKLILKKGFVEDQGWAKGRKYKLVTDCMAIEDDLLYREKLTYDLQKLYSSYHLETLLIPVRYRLADRDVEGHVILIEREEEMAKRLGFELQDPATKPVKLIHQEAYEKMVLFQYMIGNTDWNLTRGHNILWLTKDDGSISPIPVPYDFDQCGLVNASYARPYPSLPITSVRERFLQYRGKERKDLLKHRDSFAVERENALQLIVQEQNLVEESKVEISRYLDEFFLKLEDFVEI